MSGLVLVFLAVAWLGTFTCACRLLVLNRRASRRATLTLEALDIIKRCVEADFPTEETK